MQQIQEICKWNTIADNNNYNSELEKSLLQEEFNETIEAINNNDKVEILDGILDLFFVGVGTLHKLGFTPEQITEGLNRIIDNNFSKFHLKDGEYVCIKNEEGKIMKPEGFVKVYLEDLCK